MDRLPALIIVALCGCEDKKQDLEPPASRVNASKVEAKKGPSSAAFCDIHFDGDKGPKFSVPQLVGGDVPTTAKGWRWINVWATWCKPCLEEMPRLAKWRDKLSASGKPIDLVFVSVDENEADLVEHRKAHPETPPSPRLAKPDKQHEWFAALGLDGSPPIPVHVFVGPSNHVKCARAGGVREQDYAAIEKLLGE
jgi:thiol-disulfide isomerase/thioredoxin